MSITGAFESIESAAHAACEWPAEESGTHCVVVGPSETFGAIAALIAATWAPVLGYDRATEAARNTVAPIPMWLGLDEPVTSLDVAESARRVLEHRVNAFSWELTDSEIDRLSRAAGETWLAIGGR